MSFSKISSSDIKDNLINLISKEFMLISAGNEKGFNMMTASWGFVGEMWGNDCVTIAVRPQRYTMKFIEENDYFSISFYGDNKEIHKVCGSESGRDVNKAEKTGLVPVFDSDTVYFEQARLVIICKKVYADTIKEDGFIDKDALKWYKDKDYHNIIIGKIVKVLEKQ